MAEAFDPYYKWLAIAPEDQPPNLYQIVGVRTFEDDPDVIENASDQRMVHLRTFQSGKHSAESQKLLNEVAAAKIVLLNPEKKPDYDAKLRKLMQQRAAGEEDQILTVTLAGFLQQTDTAEDTPAESKPLPKATPLEEEEPEGKPKQSRAVAKEGGPDRKLLIGGAIGAGVLLLAVIVVGAMMFGGPNEAPQEAQLPKDGQQGGLPAAPKPAEPPPEEPTEPQTPDPASLPVEQPTEVPQPTEMPATPEPEPDPAADPAEPDTTLAATTPPPTPEPATPTEERLAVPAADAQATVTKQLDEIYEVDKAKTKSQKLALAKELFEAGKQSQGSPAEKFVLMRKAMELASDGGDAELMLDVIDNMGQTFDMDAMMAQGKMLGAFAKEAKDSVKIGSFVKAANRYIDQAVAAERLDFAVSIANLAYKTSLQSSGRSYRKQTLEHNRQIQELFAEHKKFQQALAALKTDPANPAANLFVGEVYCFTRGDWPTGLNHLSQGGDAALAALAKQDLAATADPNVRMTLGDGWWDASATREGREKDALKLRAGHWYQKAAPQLPAGLTKTKVERRLEQIAGISPPALATTGPADIQPPQKPTPTTVSKQQKGLSVDLLGGVKMEFVHIPAGEFVMGSPEAERQLAMEQAKADNDGWAIERIPTEAPQHRVKITKPFYLGKYEVTQAQWEAVMGNNRSQFKGPTNPVEEVSWDDIQPFLAKLNAANEKKGMQFRLPTEAQWEYACRAGTTTAFGFGDDPATLLQHGWLLDNSGGKTHPVGQGKPNAWGLYDMHGNVFEWCSDWHAKDFYVQSPPVDPVGPPTGSYRVRRGGGWLHGPGCCRSAYRHHNLPGHRHNALGFRLVLVPVDAGVKPSRETSPGT